MGFAVQGAISIDIGYIECSDIFFHLRKHEIENSEHKIKTVHNILRFHRINNRQMSIFLNLAIASTITYPFIVVRTIMHDHRAESDLSFAKIFSHIYKEKGLHGFYAGLKPDLYRLLPSNTIVFIVYEYMKRKINVKT